MSINRDIVASADVRLAATSTMQVLDAIQSIRPREYQITALACSFQLLAERVGLEPQDLFALSTNIMNHADGRRPEFAAVRQYLKEELI